MPSFWLWRVYYFIVVDDIPDPEIGMDFCSVFPSCRDNNELGPLFFPVYHVVSWTKLILINCKNIIVNILKQYRYCVVPYSYLSFFFLRFSMVESVTSFGYVRQLVPGIHRIYNLRERNVLHGHCFGLFFGSSSVVCRTGSLSWSRCFKKNR